MFDPTSGVVLAFTTAASLGLLIGTLGRRLARVVDEYRVDSVGHSDGHQQTSAATTCRPEFIANGQRP
ncbi:hypothetical protein [Mycolicibacterium sp. HS_4_1]